MINYTDSGAMENKREKYLEQLFKFNWAVKTIIAGKCSCHHRKKKKKKKLRDYSDRILNKEKMYHFMARKNSSIGNEHPAKDSSSF